MKIFRNFLVLATLWALSVNFALAQFTILPTVDEGFDCNQILNDFEVMGNFETAKESMESTAVDDVTKNMNEAYQHQQDANAALAAAQDSYNKAQEAWMDCRQTGSAADCQSQYDSYRKAVDAKDKAIEKSVNADKNFEDAKAQAQSVQADPSSANVQGELNQFRDNVLACAIKTGRISLLMIPYFITYIANFLLGISGVVTVLFIVIGGYFYVWGGLTDNKEKGKKTIINALMGMGIAILSWAIVSIVISALTS